MTSLTDRYVAATLRGIPEKQRADVDRELRSSIADALEDHVANGEDRAAAEVAVLEELGDPTRLASGMTGRPLYLVGPELFPAYRYVLFLLLAIVVPIVGIVEAAVEIGSGAGIGSALLEGIGGALSVGVHLAFWVTLAFAIVERLDPATWRREDLKDLKVLTAPWKVEYLPELPSSGAVTVGETVGEIVTAGISIGGLLYLRGWSWVTDASGQPIPLFDPALWNFWFPVAHRAARAAGRLPRRQARRRPLDDRPGRRQRGAPRRVRDPVRRARADRIAHQPGLRRRDMAGPRRWRRHRDGGGGRHLDPGQRMGSHQRLPTRPSTPPDRSGVRIMTTESTKAPSVPPRWFVRTAWIVHRAIYRVTFGRIGLWRPKPNRWGTMRLTHGRASQRPDTGRDPGLLRRRPEPGDDGDERLVGWRARLVAQSPGASRTRRSSWPTASAP